MATRNSRLMPISFRLILTGRLLVPAAYGFSLAGVFSAVLKAAGSVVGLSHGRAVPLIVSTEFEEPFAFWS